EVVDDVEHRHRDDGADVEPQGDVEAGFVAFRQGPEEVDGEDHPDDGHGDVDRPDQLGVLLAAGVAGGQGDGGGEDDELPAPHVDLRQQVRGGAAFAQPLGGVVDAGEGHVADEGEDDRVGVERAEAAEGEVGNALALEEADGDRFEEFAVHLPPGELGGADHAAEHADDGPGDGGDHELPHRAVVVGDGGGGGRRGVHL